jgi:hypothetical protein
MTAPRRDRIDFISAYCDRWCERCAFTTRCSAFAVTVATEMCDGDAEAGLELALGAPPPMTPEANAGRLEFLAFFDDFDPTEAELDAIGREEAARDERVDGHALVTACERFGLPAHAWLTAHRNSAVSPRVAAAIEVMGWDAMLIQAKLRRALHGLDASRDRRGFEEDPLQSDWNGSAKVALISIARSIRAWDVAAEVLQDNEAAAVAAELRALEAEALKCFPDAWRFKRPGFDDLRVSGGQ